MHEKKKVDLYPKWWQIYMALTVLKNPYHVWQALCTEQGKSFESKDSEITLKGAWGS